MGATPIPCGILSCVVSSSSSRISFYVHSPVARITLHNPPLHIIDVPMIEQLQTAIAEAEARSDVSVLAFSGATINVPLAGGGMTDIIASLQVSFG